MSNHITLNVIYSSKQQSGERKTNKQKSSTRLLKLVLLFPSGLIVFAYFFFFYLVLTEVCRAFIHVFYGNHQMLAETYGLSVLVKMHTLKNFQWTIYY